MAGSDVPCGNCHSILRSSLWNKCCAQRENYLLGQINILIFSRVITTSLLSLIFGIWHLKCVILSRIILWILSHTSVSFNYLRYAISSKHDNDVNNKVVNYRTINQLKYKDRRVWNVTSCVLAFASFRQFEINPLDTSGNYMDHLIEHSIALHLANRMFMSSIWLSEK